MTQAEIALYQSAINKWGIHSQLIKLMEECSELSVAASHVHFSGDISDIKLLNHLAEEIADVKNMIAQIEYGLCLSGLVEQHRSAKLARLKKRMEQR